MSTDLVDVYRQLFKRGLAIFFFKQNRVLSHFQLAKRFYLNTIYREKSSWKHNAKTGKVRFS